MQHERAWIQCRLPWVVTLDSASMWRLGSVLWAIGWVAEQRATRPTKRWECKSGPRPCPWIGCEYHLFVDVDVDNGSLWGHPAIGFPRAMPDWIPVHSTKTHDTERRLLKLFDDDRDSCALDVAERGEHTNRETGEAMGLSIRQVKEIATPARQAMFEGGREPVKKSNKLMSLMRRVAGKRKRDGRGVKPQSVKSLKRKLKALSLHEQPSLVAAWRKEIGE